MLTHGLPTSFTRCRKRPGGACDKCRESWAVYQADRRRRLGRNDQHTDRAKSRSAARGRALWQLRREYPDRFDELYRQMLAEELFDPLDETIESL
jgi:hypothetical protein